MSQSGTPERDAREVFVSYAAPDEGAVRRLVEVLEGLGLSVWLMHRDVPAGSNYTVEIDAALRTVRAFILVYSSNTVDSKGCSRELGLADELDLPVIPVRLDDAALSGRFSYLLSTVQWLDWRSPDLSDRLGSALCSPPQVATPDTAVRAKRASRKTLEMAPPAALIGREAECRTIDDLILRATESGNGQFVLIEGASGVGKSVLSRYALNRASSAGLAVAATVCEPFHEGMSFFPIRELMRQATEQGSPQRGIRAIYGPGSAEASMADLVDADGIDASARRDALLATFANLVIGAANDGSRKGLLLVIDDIERADPGTVDSLLCLLARLHEAPVVVVGTFRSDDPSIRSAGHHISPLLRAVNRVPDRVTGISVEAIRQRHMLGLAVAILGAPAQLPNRFIDRLWRETEGNPLFCREILRMLQDKRTEGGATLELRDGVWQLNGDLVGWQTPPSVEDAIRSRLELIDKTSRVELERASAIGKRFAFDLMARIAESEESDLLDLLEECVNLALIQEASGSDEAFEFTHGKIRDVLYDSMSRVRRRRLHSIVADALTGMRDLVRDEWEALIGEHLFRAARFGEAAPYLVRAAHGLVKLSAASEAARLFDQAIVAFREASGSSVELTPIRLAHVESLVAASDYERALKLATEASEDMSIDSVSQGWFVDVMGDIHRACGRREEAASAYRAAEGIAVAEQAGELELEVCADLAELFERTVEQVAGMREDEELALRGLSDQYLDRQIRLARDVGNNEAKARALRNEAKRCRRNGDIAGSLAKFEEGLALGDPRVSTHSLLISYAKTLRFADRVPEAVSVVNRVLVWSSQSGARRSLGIALHYRAMLAMELNGCDSEAKTDLLDALEIHREIAYERGQWEVLTLLGEWYVLNDERDQAVRSFRAVIPNEWPDDDDAGVQIIARQLDGIAEHGRAARLRKTWEGS